MTIGPLGPPDDVADRCRCIMAGGGAVFFADCPSHGHRAEPGGGVDLSCACGWDGHFSDLVSQFGVKSCPECGLRNTLYPADPDSGKWERERRRTDNMLADDLEAEADMDDVSGRRESMMRVAARRLRHRDRDDIRRPVRSPSPEEMDVEVEARPRWLAALIRWGIVKEEWLDE